MCLAVPSRVVAVEGAVATVEAFGRQRKVSLILLEEPVALGDYLLVQAGGHAFERLDPAAARDSLALMEGILSDGEDLRVW